VGITLSEKQAALARERIAAAGLTGTCRVELRDYRTLGRDAPFDKAASIGMVEHVGSRKLPAYFAAVLRALRPGGLFLNHGIVTIAGARPKSVLTRVMDRVWRRNEFIERYVFPDGVLVPSAAVVESAERAGFELRDVESLREHYTRTLRHWIRRLEQQHDRAVELVGEFTYRVWRLYMSGSAYAFNTGRIGVIQTLLARQCPGGMVSLPRTRGDLYDERGRD
jgi:cyclopropane-fatty-acyl-phospholipid synthase